MTGEWRGYDAAVPRLQRKSFATPDQTRRYPHGHLDVVNLDETAIGRYRHDPGWRWSVDVAPIVNTTWCQHRHVGYVISGRLHAVTEDGTTLEIGPGEAYEIPPGHDAWVVGDEPWDSVEFASARTFAQGADERGERILATILFTDIVGSTAMLEAVGDREWQRLVLAHNDRVRGAIDDYRGRELNTTGDGFLAVFDGAARAVRCAASIDPAVADLGIRVRAGIHTGEIELVGGQARGVSVHAAARVAALADSGEVLVSGTTRDLLDGSDLQFDDRGRVELKGLSGERPIFALRR
jgi:class 3 adenylate cyclase